MGGGGSQEGCFGYPVCVFVLYMCVSCMCVYPVCVLLSSSGVQGNLDKPARLIVRLLFGFASDLSFVKNMHKQGDGNAVYGIFIFFFRLKALSHVLIQIY